jgi:RNase P subunit RPR2
MFGVVMSSVLPPEMLINVEVKQTENIDLYSTHKICDYLDPMLFSICQDLKISEISFENITDKYVLSTRLQVIENTNVISLRDCYQITAAHILLLMLKYPNCASICLYVTNDDLTNRIKNNSTPCYIETHFTGKIQHIDHLPSDVVVVDTPNTIEFDLEEALADFEHYVDARHISDVQIYENQKENKQFFCEVCNKSLSIVEKDNTNVRSLDELISMESVCLQCELKKVSSDSV